jgi:hypothetical protein
MGGHDDALENIRGGEHKPDAALGDIRLACAMRISCYDTGQ